MEQRGREPKVEDFLDVPTRSLEDWHWLWREDVRFPVRNHRGVVGLVGVVVKRLFGPLVHFVLGDVWDRQRVFNLVVLERLAEDQARLQHALDRLDLLTGRVAHVEATITAGLEEVMRHDDALFSRLDVEVDRQGRKVRELLGELRAALAIAEAPRDAVARVVEESGYVELEARYRGTEAEIAERVAVWVPRLAGRGEVLDLGCGRGETLAVLAAAGVSVRGVDSSARMVQLCRDRGLRADVGDLFESLRQVPAGSLGGVVSLHVVEHLPPAALVDLTSLAFRALARGGVLVLETPNPLSMVVSSRSFWLDPTHLRPVHPEYLAHCCRLAGFEAVERVDLRPYPAAERLPEVELAALDPALHELADRINRLRDRLDDLLFGFQDYGMVATKAG